MEWSYAPGALYGKEYTHVTHPGTLTFVGVIVFTWSPLGLLCRFFFFYIRIVHEQDYASWRQYSSCNKQCISSSFHDFYITQCTCVLTITLTWLISFRGAATAYTSGTPEYTPVFSGVRVAQSFVPCVVFCIWFLLSFRTFCFVHCIVGPSTIYCFELLFWYLQTFLTLPDNEDICKLMLTMLNTICNSILLNYFILCEWSPKTFPTRFVFGLLWLRVNMRYNLCCITALQHLE